MKRIALSALSVLGLCLIGQSAAFAQIGVSVSEGSYAPEYHGNDLGPGEFMTQPELRAFGPTGDENGPTAPFFSEPMHNYTGWFRPRAVGRTQAERCYGDTFRPRGFGHLFAKSSTGMRLDYRPYQLSNWHSVHGPAYYPIAEDPRCAHCDKQGCCLSSLFGCCGTCGGGILGLCGVCGANDCDGGCEETIPCDTCDDAGCGIGCRMRSGFSEWITRPRDFAMPRLPRRARRALARNQAWAGCQDGSCGTAGCTACQQNACSTCNTGCASCQTTNTTTAPASTAGTGFIRHEESPFANTEDDWDLDGLKETQPVNPARTAYEDIPSGVVN